MTKTYTLSILIPARNEEWLAKTIQDILENKNEETEILIGLDGRWAKPGIEDHPDITMVYYPESIGQRAITDQLCKISNAKYIAKTDAHCAFDKDFDRKMIEAFEKVGDNVVMAPIMRNLHVFDIVCTDGHRRYQSPDGLCKHEIEKGVECGKETVKELMWIPKTSPQSKSFSFDFSPHFQYFNDYTKRDEFKKDLEKKGLTESMSLQGSFFMMAREKYYELEIDSKEWPSWGSQGIQLACSFWLSGGKVLINHNTWYAHCFRTQGSTFGFPYPQSGSGVQNAKKHAKKTFFERKWHKAIRPTSWLVKRFWPVTYWKDEDLKELEEMERKVWRTVTKDIIFYTDNQLTLKIAHAVQKQLKKISKDKNIPIISASLKPMEMGKNIHLPLERGVLSMYKQILACLEASTADVIFFTEHDVLYHSSHFDFEPPKKDMFYYNQNFWKIRLDDNKAVHWDANQVSGLCAYREYLLDYYRERVKAIEENGNDRSYEPGGRDKNKYVTWKSEYPNIDIRHSSNITKSKWSIDDFRDKSTCVNWEEKDELNFEGWESYSFNKLKK